MKKAKHSFLFNIIITMFIFFCSFSIIKLLINNNAQLAENERLRAENERIRYENDEFTNKLNTPVDDDYIKRLGNEKLDLRLPEEIIFYNDLIN